MSNQATVAQTVIARRLQALREHSNVDLSEAAALLGTSHMTIRRMENAESAFKIPYVASLLARYGLNEKESAEFLADVRAARQPEWWEDDYKDVVPPSCTRLLSLEEAAQTIRGYAPQTVPDLLQTEDYARAALQAQDQVLDAEAVERRVELNVQRQQRFLSGEGRRGLLEEKGDFKPQVLYLILDETVLRRAVGGRQVMRAQLQHLIDLAEGAWEQKAAKASIRLRVLPHNAGASLGTGEPFYLFRFRLYDLPDVVVRFNLEGGEYLEKPKITSAYLEHLDRTNSRSTDFRDTPDVLRVIQRELWDG
ncbi:DUF5753 domain-containing protein [Streptomyces natalensis]|uniref:HTH cro/C1-type domain-containing protein n=1 Tax=Streptomyces natalensis ATCC 27448 TaxID=1240678 RepID=A0A0D7CHR5_9ACTN|nr:DUF5753 domain-containing protein [Streptomyces natalensis]KIZ15723.1 hypothetical protein SNA_24940 [Streptomyces natalensis ATCC 27448]